MKTGKGSGVRRGQHSDNERCVERKRGKRERERMRGKES